MTLYRTEFSISNHLGRVKKIPRECNPSVSSGAYEEGQGNGPDGGLWRGGRGPLPGGPLRPPAVS